MKYKAVLVVADGMSDIPVKQLNGLTPLEAAKTPSLDKLARMGICGLMHCVDYRVPGSDTSHLALFGYDPVSCYRGRGALEALGASMKVGDNDVAFRANFATIDDNFKVLDRRSGRYNPEGDAFAEEINKLSITSVPDVTFEVKHTTEHRGVLVVRGSHLSREVTDNDPHISDVRIKDIKPIGDDPAALRTANIVNELTYSIHRLLKDHPLNTKRKREGRKPANILLFRGAGQRPEIRPFTEYHQLKGGFISATALIRGVCHAVGLSEIACENATGSINTDMIAKAKGAIKAIKRKDFMFVHVKAPDNASHDMNPQLKVEVIERFDKMIGVLLDNLDLDKTVLAVTSDHTTPVSYGDHTGEPVALALYSPVIRTDDVTTFSERSCAKGGLGHIRGIDLMAILKNQMRRLPKFGA